MGISQGQVCLFLGLLVFRSKRGARDDSQDRLESGSFALRDQLCDLIGIDYFESVVVVHLSSTQVSDVTPLANLKSLERLYLGDTQVSKENREMLQKSLPSLKIIRE